MKFKYKATTIGGREQEGKIEGVVDYKTKLEKSIFEGGYKLKE